MMRLILFILFAGLSNAWDDEYCGMSRYPDAGREIPPYETHIVGGWTARIHEFPWMVSLRYPDGLHFCGGNIITSRHVLTAAHCTDGGTLDDMEVVLAEHIRVGADPENQYKRTINMSEVIQHPDYDDFSFENDISIVVLAEELDFSQSDQAYLPVCRPDPYYNGTTLEGEVLTAAGWGATQNDNTFYPNELRYTNLRVTTNEICQGCPLMPPGFVYDDMICTGVCGTDNIRDTCWGDSGGGLVYRNPETDRFQIVAMSSWGYDCAGRTPGVHAMVSYQLDWINEQIGAY